MGPPDAVGLLCIDDDIESLVRRLPRRISDGLDGGDMERLLEIVLDLGRPPEARFLEETVVLHPVDVVRDDLQYVIDRVGDFGKDNRAGIERTLHRVSAIRNRSANIVGLTLRVGRAVYGTTRIIQDLLSTGKSILLVGKPGVGKTTMLREAARVLADDADKRVIVVDTSNEIAGDGDIPHSGIGRARRMQVPEPALQHSVMIEAVENHMPEVIIVDEIGTELDANAARTIAERGVQLVATAHGNTLDNLLANPTLSDLVGGVHTVTLGDEEARRRRTQKTVQERRGPPTFDILVEIQGWDRVTIHPDVSEVVDRILRGFPITPLVRTIDEDGNTHSVDTQPVAVLAPIGRTAPQPDNASGGAQVDAQPAQRILPYGVNKGKIQQVIQSTNAHVELVADMKDADILLTTKSYYRRRTQALRSAEDQGKPVYVLRRNTTTQIEQFIRAMGRRRNHHKSRENIDRGVQEAEAAATRVDRGERQIALTPQSAYVRHLQHEIAKKYGLASSSTGRDGGRHVVIFQR